MTDLQYVTTFDKFESEKLCNLLECSSSDLDKIIFSAKQTFEESETVYDSIMRILQQGHNVREAALISLICGKYFGYNQAEEQIEEDIKQKLFDAFNNRRG
jgi:hypothetical protein